MARTVQKKICMLGEFAVGKTSLVRRFVEGRFDDKYLSTVGVNISRKPVQLDAQTTVNFILWDIAGNNGAGPVTKSYLTGAAAALLVCDLTRADTLKQLKEHAEDFLAARPGSAIIIAANKADLEAEWKVTEAEVQAMADSLKSRWFLTSALTGKHVEAMFETLARQLEETAAHE